MKIIRKRRGRAGRIQQRKLSGKPVLSVVVGQFNPVHAIARNHPTYPRQARTLQQAAKLLGRTVMDVQFAIADLDRRCHGKLLESKCRIGLMWSGAEDGFVVLSPSTGAYRRGRQIRRSRHVY